jgi:hypothetical protein
MTCTADACRVLFVHTGGLLGMYDKLDQWQPLVQQDAPHDASNSQLRDSAQAGASVRRYLLSDV